MCLAVIEWQPDQLFPIKVVANRDEFRNRPTEPMHRWSESDIYAGKDLEAGGTWLGVTPELKFALLTNIRPGYIGKKGQRSRGNLVTEFLSGSESVEQFQQRIKPEIDSYGGFNLIVGNATGLFWFSSTNPNGHWLDPGIHALSNDALNTPWPKASLAIRQMKTEGHLLQSTLTNHGILQSTNPAADNQLPSTGVPQEWEKLLSAQTITGVDYGTRSRTHIILNNQEGHIAEQQIDSDGCITGTRQFDI